MDTVAHQKMPYLCFQSGKDLSMDLHREAIAPLEKLARAGRDTPESLGLDGIHAVSQSRRNLYKFLSVPASTGIFFSEHLDISYHQSSIEQQQNLVSFQQIYSRHHAVQHPSPPGPGHCRPVGQRPAQRRCHFRQPEYSRIGLCRDWCCGSQGPRTSTHANTSSLGECFH